MRSETIMEDGPPFSPERTMLATGVTINDGGNSLAAFVASPIGMNSSIADMPSKVIAAIWHVGHHTMCASAAPFEYLAHRRAVANTARKPSCRN
jgi:hypothetical protein